MKLFRDVHGGSFDKDVVNMELVNASIARLPFISTDSWSWGITVGWSQILVLIPFVAILWIVGSPGSASTLKVSDEVVKRDPLTYGVLGLVVAVFTSTIFRGGVGWISALLSLVVGFSVAYFFGRFHDVDGKAFLVYSAAGAAIGSVVIWVMQFLASGVSGLLLDSVLASIFATGVIAYYVTLIRNKK